VEAILRAKTEEQPIPLLALPREYRAHRKELLAACERVLDKMHLLGGEEVRSFETEMASYLGVRHVRGVASGTDALFLAVVASGIRPGDEVLIQANAFVAAVEALRAAGAIPVPVDVRPDDLGPDPDDLAARIGPRTRGIMVVHLHGLPVDIRPLVVLARERGLVLIEDCSHAHGATLAGRRVGSFGAAAAFSLGVVKNLGAYGDAGMVTTDLPDVAERVRWLGTHGQARKNEHVLYGTNSRLDEIQAALLRVKLRRLDARNRRRAQIAAHYDARFQGLLVTPLRHPERTHVYHQYVVRTPARDELRAHLTAHGIETGVHYPEPIHRHAAWLASYGEGPSLPVAERIAREMLSLPVHADLTNQEVERVSDAMLSFFDR